MVVVRALNWFKSNPIASCILIIINLGGTAFGFYYYGVITAQLSRFPAYMWIIITDCPNFTLLFAIILILYRFGYQFKLLDTLTFVGLIYAGLWTFFIGVIYHDYYFASPDIIFYEVLFFLHMGMAIEAFILWEHIKSMSPLIFLIVTSWFTINFISDYTLDTHPVIPTYRIELVIALAFISTVIPLWLVYLQNRPRRNNLPTEE